MCCGLTLLSRCALARCLLAKMMPMCGEPRFRMRILSNYSRSRQSAGSVRSADFVAAKFFDCSQRNAFYKMRYDPFYSPMSRLPQHLPDRPRRSR